MAELHPSFLRLDRISLGDDPGEWKAHLEQCEACSAYLQKQRAPLSAPEWTRAANRRVLSLRWLTSLIAAGTVAAAVALVARRPAPSSETTSKGSPSVAVYVKSGEALSLWDGQRPLLPGDRLQLEISPEELRQVAVVLREPLGRWQELYRGELSGPSSRIPESWRLDDAAGTDSLGIALSRKPLSAAEIDDALKRQVRNAEIWTTVLSLNKASHPAVSR